MKLLPYGPRAVLVEFETLEQVMSASAAWTVAEWPAVTDVVPAARTVLVVHDGAVASGLLAAPDADAPMPVGPLVTLDVTYDGADLQWVADQCGWTVEEVVRRHSAVEYTVAFCGFMPGFPYLVGLPSELHLPRRSTPRERVPAGAVAIAAGFTGVYPCESPGGWHLLGTTSAVMWSDDRDPPALLAPGTRVRFVPR